ncbi:hypothetical protein ETD86_14590 [Nonomuraea turkmeniaca]|uniref:Uncharacterized protein n=1 Tax=Nonomuraea turkmeniaca TaxID=103838 RepID=A0A5S4FLP6_9ACTN|nr:hypothetical protein [Nonomuraea turkmeniaca]TMR21648.1 hypothetical protein ETD86_14590 [Nonomuraea turkmeniaca]
MSNFEERLLSALKEEITTRTAEDKMTTTVTQVQRGSRRRLAGLSAAVAGVAAATTAVVLLTGVADNPAYAVTKGTDGSVSVRISAFTDPDGLEAELANAGVKSVVDYLPQGQTCKDPRGEKGSVTGPFSVSVGSAGGGVSFTIEKGRVPAGETLVLAVSKSEDGDDRPPFGVSLTVVKGAVADCEPTSMPVPPAGDGGVTVDKKDDGGAGFDFRTGGEDEGPSLDQKTG